MKNERNSSMPIEEQVGRKVQEKEEKEQEEEENKQVETSKEEEKEEEKREENENEQKTIIVEETKKEKKKGKKAKDKEKEEKLNGINQMANVKEKEQDVTAMDTIPLVETQENPVESREKVNQETPKMNAEVVLERKSTDSRHKSFEEKRILRKKSTDSEFRRIHGKIREKREINARALKLNKVNGEQKGGDAPKSAGVVEEKEDIKMQMLRRGFEAVKMNEEASGREEAEARKGAIPLKTIVIEEERRSEVRVRGSRSGSGGTLKSSMQEQGDSGVKQVQVNGSMSSSTINNSNGVSQVAESTKKTTGFFKTLFGKNEAAVGSETVAGNGAVSPGSGTVFGSIGEWISGKRSVSEYIAEEGEGAANTASVTLLLKQLEEQNLNLQQDPKMQMFEEKRNLVEAKRLTSVESGTMDGVDWEFWGELISDYHGLVKRDSAKVVRNVHSGIPSEIRGTVWQILSGASRNTGLIDEYRRQLPQPSRNEKLISRDVCRTFPGERYFQDPKGPGQEALFNVLKAYSLHDQDLGYCQGMAFLVAPLLLNMPEEQAFVVLERLMNHYQLRGHYITKMELLQCRMFQLDRLIEETMPLLAKHFTREGIQSSMYSSQWFMTLFACCLPMSLALRVFDLVFCEGADVLLQIALAVLKRAQPTLLTLRFESLVKYLSDGSLFTYYAQQPDDFLLADLNHITVVTTKRLAKLARDHAAVLAKADKISDTISALKAENARILRENSQMLATLQSLSTEHSDLSSQYINCKLDLQKANDTIAALNSRIDQLNQSLLTERRLAEDSLRVEMDTLAHKNLELTVQHESALEKIDYLEATLLKSNSQFVDSENQRLVLENKLLKMKKALS